MARGLTPAQARREVLLRFGDVERHGEGIRDVRWPRVLGDAWQDVRFAVRSLSRARAFSALAVLIMALGAGATTALFSLANAFLFRPLPVGAPSELYVLQEVRRGVVSIGNEGRRVPYTRYESYRAATAGSFDELAAHSYQMLSARTSEGAVAVSGVITSDNYFDVLDLAPALGRFYMRDDEAVAVLSHRYWMTRFGGAADVLGEPAYLDGRAYVVVGVAPRGFDGTSTGLGVSVWLPFRAHGSDDPGEMDRWVGMFGRITSAAGHARARATVSAVALRIPPDEPQTTVERAYLLESNGVSPPHRAARRAPPTAATFPRVQVPLSDTRAV